MRIFIVFFLLVVAAGAGMHALSHAIAFWPYMLFCFGGGSLMIAGGLSAKRRQCLELSTIIDFRPRHNGVSSG